jgi:hypothetical protein
VVVDEFIFLRTETRINDLTATIGAMNFADLFTGRTGGDLLLGLPSLFSLTSFTVIDQGQNLHSVSGARTFRAPADFIFGTRNGKPDRPENLLHRHVFPACDELGIPRATFLTLRRTFSTWSHYSGIPAQDIAALMGHAGVSTQFIYVQSMDEGKRAAAERIGAQLATIGHFSDNEIDYVH